ncbi:efflux RND transporter periplasmic adaptor subunit [Sedimentibacter sp.]|uniref:efflux RND transporter periplasmic adaptor subunit n=1 Tax=Sedimentibacter sp. TaxID=1960295 RepID=UPI00289F14D0|nr:efflux RND transporter periplasmic adaptor subunit [Sedimentibacter sp.]
MYKKVISIILVIVLVFTGGYFTAKMLVPDSSQVSNEPRYSTKPVTRGDIKQGVNITGQLNGNWGGSISVPKPEGLTDASGASVSVKYKVEELFVDANQMIKKGDNLVRLSAENLGDILEDLTKSIEEKQSSISEKTIALGKIINKDITDVSQVNPNEGIVITAPIRGRVSELSIKEGDILESANLGTIVDDSVVKIPFKVNQHEFESLKVGEEVQMQIYRVVKGATESENKEVPLFNGFITGKITALNENAVPSTDMIYYVHNGMIEAPNPGLVQPGMKALLYKQENGTPLYSLNFTSTVSSYLNEKRVQYTGNMNNATVIVTDVLVSENEFVEEGQTLIRIAGNDVTEVIQKEIDEIKKIREEIDLLYKKIDKVSELTTKMMVTAPADGMVSYLNYKVGDEIDTQNADQWSLQLMDMYNTSEMYIYTTVSDLDVLYIRQDAPVVVTVDALPGETFDGVVSNFDQWTDREGKTVYNVQIKVEGREGLRPGMNTNCFVDSGESLDTLLVPIEAVFEENGKQKVEVLTEAKEIEIVEIEVGLMNDMFVEVLGGLEEGQLVVTGSTKDLMPSQSVPENDSILPINQ